VLDVRLPGLNGLDFQDELVESNVDLPVVFITGHGDVAMSVRAIKAGAVDFLMKPFRHQDLIDASAIERHRLRRKAEATALELSNRFALLTSRERQVMLEVVGGRPNKQIAARLKISEFTVKVHRSHLMHKMKARTLVDLVRMADKLLWQGRVIVGRPLRDTIAPI
jgi:FixJ family two-component response regulator